LPEAGSLISLTRSEAMADQPDAHPDSDPSDPNHSPEPVSPDKREGHKGVEDAPGDFAGTAGTGGENKVQDQSVER
jgi:hypothetical protein